MALPVRISARSLVAASSLAAALSACAPQPAEVRTIAPAGAAATTSPVPGAAMPAETMAVLREIKETDTDLLSVSEEDGRFLQTLIAARGATRALEIGGASGYSAIWIGTALQHTGGRLTTIEYDPARSHALAANIQRAGLSDIVTVIAGDALQEIPRVPGDFDFIFIDAWKPDYKKYYDMLLPRLEPRGLLLAHNVLNKKDEMKDFLTAITTDPSVLTSIVAPSSEGMSVTVKME
jgi:caffeoyl-CoA O-methyltransferase